MMMYIFQFRDLSEREAFVLAADAGRGTAIFKCHLAANGGDPDSIMWRGRDWDDLEDGEQAVIGEAFGFEREGLLSCDVAGRWVFIIPLGAQEDPG